ncbi:hypothetical protein PAHAL_4G175000 [Panicum hallii]|jgi:hypothetical protein|uniref:Uncharacterized protein n=1 Tax=Panicum hallii TaxID=206008 RepID=A0A2T8JDA2_9POAL|nr:hypothetical protein PAHAL_4G175000 [Panicum hallii]
MPVKSGEEIDDGPPPFRVQEGGSHWPKSMESNDEFNQFVMNELIDPSSSDDENDLFFGTMHMIIEDSVNHPGRIGSVEGHDVVDHERLSGIDFFTKTIFQRILHSEQILLDAGSHVCKKIYLFFM